MHATVRGEQSCAWAPDAVSISIVRQVSIEPSRWPPRGLCICACRQLGLIRGSPQILNLDVDLGTSRSRFGVMQHLVASLSIGCTPLPARKADALASAHPR